MLSAAARAPVRFGPAAVATAVLCIGVFVGLANDLLFNLLRGSYAIYLVDYVTKAALLGIAWPAAAALAPAPAQRRPWPIVAALLVSCVVVGVGAELAAAQLEAWRLFEWPRIPWPHLRAFDLTAGLLLNAASEELIYRRIALAVLPFSARGNLVVSALLFGALHWGAGPGAILGGAITGLAFGYAYQRTGSLALVIIVHYLVDVVLFW